MEKGWEIYRDTGILGGYRPEQGILPPVQKTAMLKAVSGMQRHWQIRIV